MTKLQKVLWLVLLIGVAGLAYGVSRAVKKAIKPAADIAVQEDVASYSIYIPSPVERAAMQQLAEIWPATFHAKRPLTASKLPLFYGKLFANDKRAELGLSATQFAVTRNWSMDANTASIESLKRGLLTPLEQMFRGDRDKKQPPDSHDPRTLAELLKISASHDEVECSLFRMERLFRISQAWPYLQKEVTARYSACQGKDDLLSVWFDLNELLFSESLKDSDPAMRESVGQRLTALHQKGSPVDSFLAERLSQAAFLKSTH